MVGKILNSSVWDVMRFDGRHFETFNNSQPTRMAEFSQIQSIQTLVSDCKEHAKACIKLRVAGAAETLSITCSSLDQAESLADLIDGYCRLVTGSNTSLWNRKGELPR